MYNQKNLDSNASNLNSRSCNLSNRVGGCLSERAQHVRARPQENENTTPLKQAKQHQNNTKTTPQSVQPLL